ncbi:MAG: hypothetical protein V4697_02385 [Patescibacteria group bacterium]
MNKEQGFIKLIIMIVVALIVLGYFGFDIKKAIESPVARTNIEYAKDATVYVWNKYLKGPATYLWKEIFLNLIWEPAIENLTKRKETADSRAPNGVFVLKACLFT